MLFDRLILVYRRQYKGVKGINVVKVVNESDVKPTESIIKQAIILFQKILY